MTHLELIQARDEALGGLLRAYRRCVSAGSISPNDASLIASLSMVHESLCNQLDSLDHDDDCAASSSIGEAVLGLLDQWQAQRSEHGYSLTSIKELVAELIREGGDA